MSTTDEPGISSVTVRAIITTVQAKQVAGGELWQIYQTTSIGGHDSGIGRCYCCILVMTREVILW